MAIVNVPVTFPSQRAHTRLVRSLPRCVRHLSRTVGGMMKLYLSAALALCIAALPASTFAQTDQAKIAGTARDQSSAFVPAAQVTVKNERTGDERTATTSEQG